MKRAAPVGGAAGSADERETSQMLVSTFAHAPQADLPEPYLVWQPHIRLGNRLPAESGVIVIDGGHR